jgi:hypothetical protein
VVRDGPQPNPLRPDQTGIAPALPAALHCTPPSSLAAKPLIPTARRSTHDRHHQSREIAADYLMSAEGVVAHVDMAISAALPTRPHSCGPTPSSAALAMAAEVSMTADIPKPDWLVWAPICACGGAMLAADSQAAGACILCRKRPPRATP